MKFKYTGDQGAITLRHVTFEAGKAVELDMDNAADASLAEKISVLPYFEEVKRARRAKDGNPA